MKKGRKEGRKEGRRAKRKNIKGYLGEADNCECALSKITSRSLVLKQ